MRLSQSFCSRKPASSRPPRSRSSATIGVKSALEEISPKFEKATGNKLAITWSTAALLMKRVQAGEHADALILIKGNIDTLPKDRQDRARHRRHICASRSSRSASRPARRSRTFRRRRRSRKRCLQPKAVSYTNPASGGASGVYFAKLIEKMGIAEQMKAKTKHPPSGGFSGKPLGRRRSRHSPSIPSRKLMSVPGVEVVGPLPGDLAFTVIYAAGVQTGAASKPMRPRRWSNI